MRIEASEWIGEDRSSGDREHSPYWLGDQGLEEINVIFLNPKRVKHHTNLTGWVLRLNENTYEHGQDVSCDSRG